MLMEHNKETYEQFKAMLLEHGECCLVAATGIGKSNITAELLDDRSFDLIKILIVVPKLSIAKEWYDNSIKYGYENKIKCVTYQYFSRHFTDLYGFDGYVFDEAHHAGSLKWGLAIKKFRNSIKNELIIGLTADPNRYSDRYGNNNVVDCIFSGHVVYGLDRKDAVDKGILPKASYICALFDTESVYKKYMNKKMTDRLRGRLQLSYKNIKNINKIIKSHLPKSSHVKGIIFVDSIQNIDRGRKLVEDVFNQQAQYIHSNLSHKENLDTLNDFKQSKSGFIVTVDMLNEGLHIPGVNVLIMLRRTRSPQLYMQQIGRGLAASGENITIYDFVRNDVSIKKVLGEIKSIEDTIKRNNSTRSKMSIRISDQSIVKDYASDILSVLQDIDRYSKSQWTNDEDDILRQYYPENGAVYTSKLLDRSITSCRNRAYQLGISTELCPKEWTKDEEQILIDNYPKIGGNVYKLLPNRSKAACIARANKLNLSPPVKKWTVSEDEILKKFYPSIGTDVSTLLKNRSASACLIRAEKLGLSSPSNYSKEEDEIIIKHYPTMGSKVYKLLSNRSEKSCDARARRLGVSKLSNNNKRWTKEEDDIIRQYYPLLGRSGILDMLPGRTIDTIGGRAVRLGVRGSRPGGKNSKK